MKIAFLDRDGTISKEYPDEEWNSITEPILLEGTIEGLKKIKDQGYEFIILTNQGLISKGIITEKQYEEYTNKLINILKENNINILKVYHCPHRSIDNCNCKKPKTGMIDNALEEFDIDLANSFYIGDSYSDYELAKKFNLDFYGIKGRNNDDIFKYENINEIF
jgi:D-glycero-D-manno-heptose 1,7-bisphosphate phosphatase